MSTSKLDAVYRSILITKFFTKGWGKPENLKRLFEFRKIVSDRNECFKLVDRDYPVTITKEQNLTDCKLVEGYFLTPLEKYLPGIVPEIAQKAHFQALLPVHWPDPACKPMCLHLAGTGDHFFWRRRNLMVKPLLKEAGIGGIILENPFYGLRKPTDQIRSSLHNVSDIFVMGGCLILESLVLFHWCERNGLGPLGVTGLSMGGHMASLAATNWPKPLVLVPCLSWSTASAVFLQGVMAHSINWDLLEDQYLSDGIYREKLKKMVTIVDEAFLAGKKFARTYSENIHTNIHSNIRTPSPESLKNTLKCEPQFKRLDITYKEARANNNYMEAQDNVDVNKNILEVKNVPENNLKSDVSAQIRDLKSQLKILLEENKISQMLYDKLTSNQKFELEPQDIDDINKLNEEKVKEILLRCKIVDLTKNETEDKEVRVASPIPVTLEEVKQSIQDPENSDDESQKENITTMSSENKKMKESPTGKEVAIKADKKSWNVSEITSDIWTNLPFVRSGGKKIDIGKIHWRDREALQFMRGIMDECTHLSNFSVPYDTSLIIGNEPWKKYLSKIIRNCRGQEDRISSKSSVVCSIQFDQNFYAVCAKHDAYVPRDDVGTLEEIWPGAEVRYVDAGHVSAYILHQSLFRSCIIEAFERSKKKWKDGKHID